MCAHPPGRPAPDSPVVREMLRALGVVVCPRCSVVIRIAAGRGRWFERR